MDVSVIIVNWNTRDILRNCLSSVFKQTQGIEFEVIVIDNGSSDSSIQMVKAEFPQVTVIANMENRGFAAANNQGIAVAEGRYVLLLNSDTVLLNNAIGKTVAFADKHPDAAVIGCRVLNPDRTLQPTCFMFPSLLNMFLSSTYLYKLFPKSRFFGRERMTWWLRDNVRDVDVVTGCFMLVRQEAIKQVGIMDERFFVYGEETDWCYRFKKAGWEIIFAPVAEIVHFGGMSSWKMRARMRLQLSASILLFMRKHRSWGAYTVSCLLQSIFFLLRIPFWAGKVCFCSRDRFDSWCTVQTYAVGFVGALRGYKGLWIRK